MPQTGAKQVTETARLWRGDNSILELSEILLVSKAYSLSCPGKTLSELLSVAAPDTQEVARAGKQRHCGGRLPLGEAGPPLLVSSAKDPSSVSTKAQLSPEDHSLKMEDGARIVCTLPLHLVPTAS